MNHSDVMDFRMLDVEELQELYDAMQTNSENEICTDFGSTCRHQPAAEAGKLVFLKEVATDIDFKSFKASHLQEALGIYRVLAKKFKTTNKPAAKKFCEMIIVRCRGGLEALQEKDEENGPDVSANDYLPFILGLYLGSKLAQEFEIHLQGGE